MLWLALHLPRLPLEAQPSRPPPSAIVSRERIVVGDDAALAGGVQPGMRLAAAWALLPELRVRERDMAAEQAALQRLACWAGAFASEVCLLPPHTLLLEVGASLRLFGGAALLFEAVIAGCVEQGCTPLPAMAPTPLAAQWLAAAGDEQPCLVVAELAQRLGVLPLAVLGLAPAELSRLAGFGARTLADVLHLPRAGLARRMGAACVADLARALGELPDPRPRFVFPERFAERLALPARIDSALALAFAGRRLIAALCGWLAARCAGVGECVFELEHERGLQARPATRLVLGFAGATRDPERIGRVLHERLQRLVLPAAVEAVVLRAGVPEALGGRESSLFGRERGDASSVAALVERLQARLGNDGVHGLLSIPEHRPENASRPVSPALSPAARPGQRDGRPRPAPAARPTWLLRDPQALSERDGRPQRGGPLQLLAGPERIESGWWDAAEPGGVGDVRRDYFIALSPRAEWLWIFRCEAGWFLHGFFA